MNAALKTFARSTTGTLLSWSDDRHAERDFQGASWSKELLLKLSVLLFATHHDLRQLNSSEKIQVDSRRSASVPQT